MVLRAGDLTRTFSSLVELLDVRGGEHPERVAYTFLKDAGDFQGITYGGLKRKACAIAAHLVERASPGDRVLLLYPPGLDFLSAFFGCLAARVIPAPLPLAGARSGLEKIALVGQDTSARLALTVSLLASEVQSGLASVHVAATDTIDETIGAGFETTPAQPADLAYLQYTSGSTSVPRGVMVSHQNVLHNIANIDAGFRHNADSVLVSWLPHFHDMGLIYGLIAPLFHGVSCYLMSPAVFVQRPIVWLEAITRFKATHSGGPNFAYDLCVRRIAPEMRSGLDLSSWEVAFNGAEPVHAETLQRFTAAFQGCGFRREAFYPAYGLAEASLKVSGGRKSAPPVIFAASTSGLAANLVQSVPADDPDARLMVGCGQAGPDTTVKIVDAEQRKECAAGQVGEIWVSGPGVALGYWNREEDTSEIFRAYLNESGEGPFLRTGDLGFIHDAELYIAGRLKDLIIIRGLNHHPSDIELTARQAHPEVAASVSAAFSIDAGGDERLVIAIEAARQTLSDPEEIAARVRQEIAAKHQVSAYSVAFVKKGAIPKTSSGKIQRRLCRSLYLARKLDILYESITAQVSLSEDVSALDREALLATVPAERVNVTVEHLRTLLARLLKQKPDPIDPAKPITSFGIDSLIAMELQNHLEQDFGVRLDATQLLAGGDLIELASLIVDKLATGAAAHDRIPALHNSRAPLSFEQERLWLLNQILPGNPAQHIPIAIRIAGPLNHRALENSVTELIRRHESLRCSFEKERCIIHPPFEARVAEESVQSLEEVQRRIVEESERPFRLDESPLFRLRLFRAGPEDHVALLVMHHMISDLWSVRIFFEELFSHYLSLEDRAPSPIQYSDFAVWQRQNLQGTKLEGLVTYWQEHLQGARGLAIPTDHSRPKGPSFQAASEAFSIPDELSEALRTFCRHEGVTPFVALLASFEALLARCTGQHDLVIGTTSANRHRPELERIIGFFAAPLVLRLGVDGDEPFRELLGKVRREVLNAAAHSELPFAKVVEVTRTGSTPLVRVMFSLFKSPVPETSVPGLSITPFDVRPGATDFDLFVNLVEQGTRLQGIAVYNTSLYQPETVRSLVKAFVEVLELAVSAPATRISQFRLPETLNRRKHGLPTREEVPAIVVTATFTAEPVEEVLRFWVSELDFDYRIRFAPYNQVFQQLLELASIVAANRSGLNVVLVRFEDWARDRVSPDLAELEDTVNRFISSVQSAAATSPAAFLVCICPPSPTFVSTVEREAFHKRMEDLVASGLTHSNAAYVVIPAEVQHLYPVAAYYDAHGDRLGHVPYTPEFYAALGTVIARKIHAMRIQPFKVITLDCDQTLWSGICGEDGPSGITIDAPRHGLQDFILRQRDAGMLLCLATKNNDEDVWATFDANPQMPLQRHHLSAARINWKPKSGNLRALAAELELGVDSFIHIDDSPTECAEIEANCPEVLALQLPPEPDTIPAYLRHVWAFDRLTTTKEDTARSAQYSQRTERRKLQHQVATMREFLDALNLDIRIDSARPEQLPRVSQLTQRTNQMNFTTIRRSEGEIRDLLQSDDTECLVVDLSDRFGDYGLVGVIIYRVSGDVLDVDSFLISCRALGRGVEHQMVARLGEIAQERALSSVLLRFSSTAKNRPAQEFLETIGSGWEDPVGYRLSAPYAASVTYNPSERPSLPSASESAAIPTEKRVRNLPNYHRIATELNDAGKILQRVRATLHAGVVTTTPYKAPRTPLEKELAALWEEMLHAAQVGVEDNFFDLGGHSLLAVQLLSRVREAYNVDLPLDVVFTGNFCVAELAKAIEIHEIEQAGEEQYSELLKELEGLSDEEVRALLEQELQNDVTRGGDAP